MKKKCGLAYSKKFLSKVLKFFSKVIENVVALRLTIICVIMISMKVFSLLKRNAIVVT